MAVGAHYESNLDLDLFYLSANIKLCNIKGLEELQCPNYVVKLTKITEMAPLEWHPKGAL